MTTACEWAKNVIDRPEVRRKTVHIVLEGGIVVDAYADCDVDVVVYDLDCKDDPEMFAEVKAEVAKLAEHSHPVDIL